MNYEIDLVKDWEKRTGLKGRALARYLGLPEATLRDAGRNERIVGISPDGWFTAKVKRRTK